MLVSQNSELVIIPRLSLSPPLYIMQTALLFIPAANNMAFVEPLLYDYISWMWACWLWDFSLFCQGKNYTDYRGVFCFDWFSVEMEASFSAVRDMTFHLMAPNRALILLSNPECEGRIFRGLGTKPATPWQSTLLCTHFSAPFLSMLFLVYAVKVSNDHLRYGVVVLVFRMSKIWANQWKIVFWSLTHISIYVFPVADWWTLVRARNSILLFLHGI